MPKRICTVFFLLLFVCKIAAGQQPIPANVPDSLLSNRQYMVKLLPQVISFAGDKAQLHLIDVSPDSVELINRYPELLIGKFLDSIRTFAILYEEPDSALTFFRLQDNNWKQIGYRHYTNYLGFYRFEELNGDRNLEVLASSSPNMNGNSWIDLFTFSEAKDSIVFAGDLCCDYEVDLIKKEIREWHEGSWYMDLYKTIYSWNNGMLLPKKQIRLTLLNADKAWNHKAKYEISMWDNPELTYSSKYRLLLKDRYRKKKYEKLWDNFFELN